MSRTFLTQVNAPAHQTSGLTGAVSVTRYAGGTASGPPVSGTFVTGDFVIAQNGRIHICTAGGTPGTWASSVGLGNVNAFTAEQQAPVWTTSGLTGATTQTRHVGGTAAVAPTTGTFVAGDFVVTLTGAIFVCTSGGTPGTWVNVAASTGPSNMATTDTTQTITGAKTFSAALAVGTGTNQNIILTGGAGSHGVEVGRQDGVSSTPFIDMHSGATQVDYDVRLIASGGTGTSGQATLEVQAAQVFIRAQLASAIPFVVRGAVSQVGNLQEWQDNTPTVVAHVGPTGAMRAPSFQAPAGTGPYLDFNSGTAGIFINRTTITNVPLMVQGMASQSGDLQRWQTSTPTVVAAIGPDGGARAPYYQSIAGSGPYVVTSGSDVIAANRTTITNVVLRARGMASQSGDLQRWEDSVAATLAKVDAAGLATFPAYAASGITGAVTATRYVGGTATVAPTTGTFLTGDWVISANGHIWICTAGGTPGTWVDAAGSGPANMVTTDTTQNITGLKTFQAASGSSAVLLSTSGGAVTDSQYLEVQARSIFGYSNGTIVVGDKGTTKIFEVRLGTLNTASDRRFGVSTVAVTSYMNFVTPVVQVGGLFGSDASTVTRYVGGTASGAPTTGTFVTGDWVVVTSGTIFICTAGGTPGTWTQIAGTGGSGGDTVTAAKTTNYTASAGEFVPVNAVGGAVTVTIPSSPATGSFVTIKKVDASTFPVTIGAGGKTIDGDASATITTQWTTVTLTYDGANYLSKSTSRDDAGAGIYTAPGRNVLRNGDFAVWQRGTTFTSASGAYYGMAADGWLYDYTGTTTQGTFARTTIASGLDGRWGVTIGANGMSLTTDAAVFSQRIEGVQTLQGKTVALSLDVSVTAGTASLGVEIRQNFGTGGAPSGEIGTTLTPITLISTTNTRRTLVFNIPSTSGKTRGTNNDDFLEIKFWLSAGSIFNANSGSIGIQNKTWSVARIQLELGGVATEFDALNPQAQISWCQRYFWRETSTSNTFFYPRVALMAYSTTHLVGSVTHPVPMRATPTFTPSAGLPSAYNATGTPVAITSVSTTGTHAGAAVVDCTTSGMTAGQATFLLSSSSVGTGQYLEASAEL